jgi:sulfur carrier protein
MLQVNDEPLEHEPGMTVEDILKRKNYKFRMLAVWIDGEFVPRGTYERTPVPDRADVKVVHMIAGG